MNKIAFTTSEHDFAVPLDPRFGRAGGNPGTALAKSGC